MIAITATPPITQSTIKPGLARKDHKINIMVLYGQAQFIIVIELRRVKFDWSHTRYFKIERAQRASLIWDHMYDFRSKLHNINYKQLYSVNSIKDENARVFT